MSDQNKELLKHADQDGNHFIHEPYINEAQKIYADAKQIVIKGLGLAMIDVVRMIMEHHKSSFECKSESIFLKYTGNTDVEIVPYSLDGLAMVPKPIGKEIDDYFDPNNAEKEQMLIQLKKNIADGKV
jgi:hypothetical protein